jgi:hypothetical protein
VLQEEEMQRSAVREHYQHKVKATILGKARDSSYLKHETDVLNKEYEKMAAREKLLLEESNRSLEASQLMRSKYNDVMAVARRNHSSRIPELRAKETPGSRRANS